MRPDPTPVLVIVDEGYYGHEALEDELGPAYRVTVAEGLGGAIEALPTLACPIVLAPRTLSPDTGDAVLDALFAHRFDFVGLLMVDDDVPTPSRGVHGLIRRPLRPGAFTEHVRAAATMRARLLEATARRAELAADMAHLAHHLRHDLMGHIQSLLGFLSLAAEVPDADLVTHALRVTNRLSRHITHVGDWLTQSRRPLEPAIVDLGELVAEAVAEARLAVPEVTLQPPPSALVPGDGRALALAVTRLIDRAAAHHPRVEVAVAPTPEGWAVLVTDRAAPLSAPACARLCERFDSPDGPGLAVVSRVAARHGGTLTLTPTEGGHVAVLALPRAVSSVSHVSSHPDDSMKSKVEPVVSRVSDVSSLAAPGGDA